MSVIHRTTMSPTKLEMLTEWLPTRSWFRGGTPEFAVTGGFRLDDPAGDVGLEFIVVTDASGPEPVYYHTPLAYRGEPLDGGEDGLVSTCEHGVLGKRWIYDGAQDPVLIAQLFALVIGQAEPQMQKISNTPDPSVLREFTGPAHTADATPRQITDTDHGTDIVITTGRPAADLILTIHRTLTPNTTTKAQGHVTAPLRLTDNTQARAIYAELNPTSQN